MTSLIKFLVLFLFALVVASCSGNDGENEVETPSTTPEVREEQPAAETPSNTPEVREEQPTEQPADIGDIEHPGGLEISILSITNKPSSNPTGGMLTFLAELEVQIGNGSDKTIEFDHVRTIFYDEGRFVSGEICSPGEVPTVCWHWYEEDEPVQPDMFVESIKLPPGMAAVFHVSSGGDFMIDESTPQYIKIAVISEGVVLVENVYEY